MVVQSMMDDASPSQLDFARILVVDDSATNRVIAAKFLAKCPTRIVDLRLASSADEALQWLRTRVFDIVFMDINLGGVVSGTDIACAIRHADTEVCTCEVASKPGILAENARAFVLAFTTDVTGEQIESYRKARMNGVLAKPFSAQSINTALQQRYGPTVPCSSTSTTFFVVTRSHAIQQVAPRPRIGAGSSMTSASVGAVYLAGRNASAAQCSFAAANAACMRPRVGRAITSPENIITTAADTASMLAAVPSPTMILPKVTVSPIIWTSASDDSHSAASSSATSILRSDPPRLPSRMRDEHQLLENVSSRRSSAGSDAGGVSHRFSTCTISTSSTTATECDSIFSDHDGLLTKSGDVTSAESLLWDESPEDVLSAKEGSTLSASIDLEAMSVYSLTPPAAYAPPAQDPSTSYICTRVDGEGRPTVGHPSSTASNARVVLEDGFPPSPALSASSSQRSWRSLRLASPPPVSPYLQAQEACCDTSLRHGEEASLPMPWDHPPLNYSALSITSIASSPPHLGTSAAVPAKKTSPRVSPYNQPFNRGKTKGERRALSARSAEDRSSRVGILGPGVRLARRLRGE